MAEDPHKMAVEIQSNSEIAGVLLSLTVRGPTCPQDPGQWRVFGRKILDRQMGVLLQHPWLLQSTQRTIRSEKCHRLALTIEIQPRTLQRERRDRYLIELEINLEAPWKDHCLGVHQSSNHRIKTPLPAITRWEIYYLGRTTITKWGQEAKKKSWRILPYCQASNRTWKPPWSSSRNACNSRRAAGFWLRRYWLRSEKGAKLATMRE